MKSLRSTGTETASRTWTRSSSEPPNRRSSVSTEIAAAPPASYAAARAAGSLIVASAPLLGLDRLTSAMTATPGPRSSGIGFEGGVDDLDPLLEPVQARRGLAEGEVLPDPSDDVVESAHSTAA